MSDWATGDHVTVRLEPFHARRHGGSPPRTRWQSWNQGQPGPVALRAGGRGVPVRRDGHHLSVDYARALAPELARLFTETGLLAQPVVAPDDAAESEAPTAGAAVRGGATRPTPP